MDDMNQLITLLPNLPFLALLVPLFMAWGQIKGFLLNIIRLVLVETQVSGVASTALLQYLRLHGKRMPTNMLKYASSWVYAKSRGNQSILLFEGSRDLPTQWYWFQGSLFTVTEKRGQDKERGVMIDNLSSLRYLRGTVDAEALIRGTIEWFENKDKEAFDTIKVPRFYVRRFIGQGPNATANQAVYGENTKPSNSVPSPAADEDWRFARLLNYSLPDLGYSSKLFFHVFNENAQKIVADVERWFKSKEWYEEKGLLWKRGALMHGIPGSGKSSLIRKIGQKIDVPVFSFELSTMTDPQFIIFWDEARRSGPCIVVMEDIDVVFKGRKPANSNIKLSFECLLNCISGVEPAEGIYLFVTTNHLEYLDEALGIPDKNGVSTRPGRLDNCFHMGEITIEEKRQITAHFLGEHPEIGARLIEESNGCTAAQFSDMCSQKALELHWNKS